MYVDTPEIITLSSSNNVFVPFVRTETWLALSHTKDTSWYVSTVVSILVIVLPSNSET